VTDFGEMIAIGGLDVELSARCPFKEDALGVDSTESEGISKDDSEGATEQQENDGGVLGRNLASGSAGADGTVGGPFPPPSSQGVARRDTRRVGVKVKVPGTSSIPDGAYGFTVAAHHLIPGDASLAPSNLKKYMTKGDSVEVDTGSGSSNKTIRKHIGYNVNGAHNGVWLPGNYYIRAGTSPIPGTTWSELGDNPWCLHYVAAVSKAAGGQIHDAHTQYSAAVEDLLNKIALRLSRHECDDCKTGEINPPFQIKGRLYSLSAFFRSQVTRQPSGWKRPWFTSDRWREGAFSGGKPSQAFESAYNSASAVDPTTDVG
jgi:hypothetical protein